MDANTLNKNTFILMRKLFIFVCLSAFSVAFAQSKDLTKKQAYEAFKNSELRKFENLKISDFNKIYKTAICVKKTYSDTEHFPDALKLKTMPIFKNSKKTESIERVSKCAPRSEFCIYGIDMWILAGSTDKESKELRKPENCFF